ncbi:MAG: fumarylacetoacetase [Vicinamibacteria bacterium]|nr:fumarylacetoacetase [Vicinamibacteria bacterium]
MTAHVDETHDPKIHSFVESAQDPATDFPLQNLPLGVFRRAGTAEPPRIGIAIGDRILDLRACHERGLLRGMGDPVLEAALAPNLNAYLALDARLRRTLRHRAWHLLRAEGAQVTARPHAADVLVAQADAELLLPAAIGDYTDFYASLHHATNVGKMLRPDNPLLPNWKWIPIGYHGRTSSIVPSGAPVRRPSGQTEPKDGGAPGFGPSRNLDYELEVGAFLGPGNPLGATIPLADAEQHLAGLCLVNDWSARDVQKWEYAPLGPFLAKNFATTISPWLVTLEALAPFRVAPEPRADGDPQPLPYLADERDRERGGFDVALRVELRTKAMRERGLVPFVVSTSNLRDLYWTLGQMVAHHASGGCNLRPGDLIATGTVSGPAPENRACLLERTWRGSEPLTLPSGEVRRFLEDGDEINLRGRCLRDGFRAIGFGECRGEILPVQP